MSAAKRTFHINLSLNDLQQRAYVGVNRAAAFLGLSEKITENEIPRSLSLGQSVRLQLIPDPLTDELAEEIRSSFRTWIVGNALRELDQFLSLALDQAWDFAKGVQLYAGSQKLWRSIERITNVATKYEKVLKEMGRFNEAHHDDHGCLVTLSHARNALSHDLGLVTHKRAPSGSLQIRWLAFELRINDGNTVRVLRPDAMPMSVERGASIEFAVVFHERTFDVGSFIILSAEELLEICLFYKIVIDRLCTALKEYGLEAGIPFPEEGQPPVKLQKLVGEKDWRPREG